MQVLAVDDLGSLAAVHFKVNPVDKLVGVHFKQSFLAFIVVTVSGVFIGYAL